MARFMKIQNGDTEYVWDQEKYVLYRGNFETGIFSPAPNGMTMIHLSKFAPDADNLGCLTSAPLGRIEVIA